MPVWELYTYGNGDFLRWLFNGIVAVMGQSGYISVIQITVYASLAYVLIRMGLLQRDYGLELAGWVCPDL
jgi:conjugal transfer mating pair stabilization protein TraG